VFQVEQNDKIDDWLIVGFVASSGKYDMHMHDDEHIE
jgi:hypothetical protein